jgi:hypothetical protein
MVSVAQTPKQADILRKNPLGLYVDAIDWSRELDSAADRPAPAIRHAGRQSSLPGPDRAARCWRPGHHAFSIGEPSMKTLFLVASLLAGAAAWRPPNLAAPPKPNPTQTATAAAQVAGAQSLLSSQR